MRETRSAMVLGMAVLAGILTLGFGNAALAFHGGGVAHCDGCHSMHNSPENPSAGRSDLLIGNGPSSTCLSCHARAGRSYNIKSSNGSSYTPGGDYFWLTASYSNVVRGNTVNNDPDNTGHNVVATDYGLNQDGTNLRAPGGLYPSSALGCTSCHDPHGQANGGTAGGAPPISVSGSYGDEPPAGTQAGNYRLLSEDVATAPIAVTAGFGETDTSHPAYGQGMSEWCGGCHTQYAGLQAGKHVNGADAILNGESSNYNSYVATGDFTGTQATSFLQFVQFERGTDVRADLAAAVTSTQGPDASANVLCLTCHRAHASAFNNAGRWDFETDFLAHSTPSATNLAALGAPPNAHYYGRSIATEFGEYQRSFCNKCHVQD